MLIKKSLSLIKKSIFFTSIFLLTSCVLVKPVDNDYGLGVLESRFEKGLYEINAFCRSWKVFEENKKNAKKYCEFQGKEFLLKSQVSVQQGISGGTCTTQFVCGEQKQNSELFIENQRPIYPSQSKRDGEQGTVLLNVKISDSGFVEKIEVEKTSGYLRLDQAALDAVKQWKFREDYELGKWKKVPITFKLNE